MSLTRFIKKGELTVCLFLFDLLFLTFLLYLSFLFRLYLFPIFFSSFFPLTHSFKKYLCLIFVYLLIFIYGGSYKRIFCWDEVKLIWESVIITTVVIFFMLFVTNQFEQYSVSVIIIWLSLCFLLLPIIRPIIKSLLYKAGIGKARLLIIGAGKKVEKFLNAIEQEKNLGYEVVGFLDNFWEDIDRDIEFLNIDAVAIIMNNMSEETISKLVNKIYHKVNTIFYIFDIPEMPTAISKLRNFFKEDMFAIEVENKIKNPFNYILKRGFDLVISFFLLPFIILFLVFVSIFIRLTSKGPAILSQERVGKNGRIFKCYKLRTMYEDADKKLEEILRSNPNAKREWENSWKLKNDPRITPIGKFLRKFSLDELPQIWNIIKGEMSLIGPRPYLPREIKYLENYADIIWSVKPGVSGLWQISGRSNTTYKERLRLDCWYVRNWSFWLDILILLKTIKVVIKREGAY